MNKNIIQMKDSKINMNKPPLSEKEINDAKNFDNIISKVNGEDPDPKAKSSKGKLSIIIGAGITLLIGGIYWLVPSTNKTTEKEITSKVEKYQSVKPPMENLDIPFLTFTINASEGDTIVTSKGTEIFIPANALKNQKGDLIKGEATIKFREFHDVPSIFVAGVAMQYDSAGQEYHFESAGMFEIQGYKGNEKLFTNPEAPITVALASQQEGDYFNIYFQDPEKGWQFIRKDTSKLALSNLIDTIVMIGDISKSTEADLKKKKSEMDKAKKSYVKALEKTGLIIPQIANDDLYSMKISFLNSEFPELAGFKNVLFEITEENKDFDPALASQDWKGIELKKNVVGNYVMHLFGKTKEKLIVRPVFSEKDIEVANSKFDELFEEYDTKLLGKLSEEREALNKATQTFKATEDLVYAEINAMMGVNLNQSKVDEETYKIKRMFTVSNFGMWNSDCPQNMPRGQEVYPVFVNIDKTDDTLTFENLYIAEYDKNALYTYYNSWGNRKIMNDNGKMENLFENPLFTFNPNNKTVVWFVTNNGKLAVIEPDELKKVIFTEGNTTVAMKLYENVKDEKEIKKILGWK